MSAGVGCGEAKTTAIEPMALPPLGERPLVSVLVSNFNYAAYLGEAIEGVLGQTYGNLELIVCDDGSTDGSREVIERYAGLDTRLRPIFQENAGQAAALNAAFQASSGEVISLLDADDVFLPEKLQRVVEAFVSHPGSGFAIHRMRRVDRGRGYWGEIPLVFGMPSGWRGASLPLTATTMPPGLPPCSGLSLRRAVAERLFPLPTGLRAYADTLIQILAPRITPIVAIEALLAEYRVHGGNVGGVASLTETPLAPLGELRERGLEGVEGVPGVGSSGIVRQPPAARRGPCVRERLCLRALPFRRQGEASLPNVYWFPFLRKHAEVIPLVLEVHDPSP